MVETLLQIFLIAYAIGWLLRKPAYWLFWAITSDGTKPKRPHRHLSL